MEDIREAQTSIEPKLQHEPRLLLVEDSPADAEYIRILLKQDSDHTFHFDWARDLQSALDRLAATPYDLALLDPGLPDSVGIDTLRTMLSKFPQIPVVVLTGLADVGVGEEMVKAGAQDYLSKDRLDTGLLCRTIAHALERFRNVSALKESEERYRDLFENANDMICILSPDQQLKYVNRACARQLDYAAGELMGRAFTDLILPERAQSWRDICDAIIRRGQSIDRYETTLVSKHGRRIDVEGGLSLRARPGGLPSLRLILRDVTQVKALQKMKDEFIGIVSHEIRSPLTVVHGAVDILAEGLAGELAPAQREYVDMAARALERVERVLRNVLEISRLQSGKAKLEKIKLNIPKCVETAVGTFKDDAARKQIELSFESPHPVPDIYADPDMIDRVLNNLISNAVRFARSRVRIHVQSVDNAAALGAAAPRPGHAWPPANPDGWLHLRVEDDGEGIEPEDREAVFDRFVQMKRKRKDKEGYKGTGLGLSICREIVVLHRGEIWAAGDPGLGTEFHVLIPAYHPREIMLSDLLSDLKFAAADKPTVSLVSLRVADELRRSISFQDRRAALGRLADQLKTGMRETNGDQLYLMPGQIVVKLVTDEAGVQAFLSRNNKVIQEAGERLATGSSVASPLRTESVTLISIDPGVDRFLNLAARLTQ